MQLQQSVKLKELNEGSKEKWGATYTGVHLIEVSVKTEVTVYLI